MDHSRKKWGEKGKGITAKKEKEDTQKKRGGADSLRSTTEKTDWPRMRDLINMGRIQRRES